MLLLPKVKLTEIVFMSYHCINKQFCVLTRFFMSWTSFQQEEICEGQVKSVQISFLSPLGQEDRSS